MKRDELTEAKATIIYTGTMGVNAIEVSAFRIATAPYAQHKESVSCLYVKRGKRKPEGVRFTDNVNIVVVEGWGLPKADDTIRAATSEHIADEETESAASVYVNALVQTGRKVLVDFRGHKVNGLGKAPTFAE
jgi:pantothenate kinase-related protein Tda10